jgi:short subunit dehydrogenase-like uncharacterized protein
MKPYALSPIPEPKNKTGESFLTKLLGYRNVPDLGILTDSPQSGSDIGIVYRSWGLFNSGEWYGHKFTFEEWARVPSAFMGAIVHYALSFGMIALYFAPFRWFLKRYAYEPGQGQTKEEVTKNEMHYKCIATSDSPEKKRAASTFGYLGGGYYLTGILVVEAAMTVLRGKENLAKKLGGMVTPACLEMEYVERLKKAGVKIEVGMMNN